jgi:hypothetical protein
MYKRFAPNRLQEGREYTSALPLMRIVQYSPSQEKQGIEELVLCVETTQTNRLHILAVGKRAQHRAEDLCFAQH